VFSKTDAVLQGTIELLVLKRLSRGRCTGTALRIRGAGDRLAAPLERGESRRHLHRAARDRRASMNKDPKQEVEEERRFHLEQRTRDYIARGMSPEAARAAQGSGSATPHA
jgi:hypothetical protein